MDSSESFICACGFFARAETDNMCYRCYQQKLRSAKKTPAAMSTKEEDVLIKSSKIDESVAEEQPPNTQTDPNEPLIGETKSTPRLEDDVVAQDLKAFVTGGEESSGTKRRRHHLSRNVIIDDASFWVKGILQNWRIVDPSEEPRPNAVLVEFITKPTRDYRDDEVVAFEVLRPTPPPPPPSPDVDDVVRREERRCGVCKKRLLLTSIECRCKHKFCAIHRYPEEHACTYDYKSEGRKALAKKLPKIVADKIKRIG